MKGVFLMNENEREFSWDDEIEKDGGEFTLLPEGDYDFTVKSFERGRHSGSDKLPPCNKAILTITICVKDDCIDIKHNLFLHSRCEGFLSAFFTSIGQKKHGEKLKMNWNTVTGTKGKCRVYIDKYKGSDGKEHTSNKIKKFYSPDEKVQTNNPQVNNAPQSDKWAGAWN